jgi:hypothetical protein
MVIKYNPRITNKFVKVILKLDKVKEALRNVDSMEEREQIVHEVLIAGFTKYEVDINDLINFLKNQKE